MFKAKTQSHRDLVVWQKAMELARQCYVLCQKLPRNEEFGLSAQMRRAAVSIPSNIAEGHGRVSNAQMRYFLGNARGSLYELQTQLELASGMGLLPQEEVQLLLQQAEDVARLTNALIASLAESKT